MTLGWSGRAPLELSLDDFGLEWAPLELSLDDFDMLYNLLIIYYLANFLIYYSDNAMFSSCKSTEKISFLWFQSMLENVEMPPL